MNEHAVLLGRSKTLVGIISEPADNVLIQDELAVILLNSGLIHRIGPHRLYVKIARALAALGFLTVRFDLSGVGDTPTRKDTLPLQEAMIQEPSEIMDDLARMKGAKRFVLMGICWGAYCSFKSASADPRVIGAVLINPVEFARDPNLASYLRARQYLTKSLSSTRSWINLCTGRVAYRRLVKVIWHQLTKGLHGQNRQTISLAKGIRMDIQSLVDRRVAMLFILSEKDLSMDFLSLIFGKDMRTTTIGGILQCETISGADHLFHRMADQRRVLQVIENWAVNLSRLLEQDATGAPERSSNLAGTVRE